MTAYRLALAAVVAVALIGAVQHPHWTYEGADGPSHWGNLDAAYHTCEVGKHQSPISIQDATPADLPAVTFSYQPVPLKLIDNGHTVQVTYAPGSFITVNDHKYELQQFHFHHPAEEQVNGRPYPMVAHLVHKDAAGRLGVVAVLLDQGQANAVVQTVWKYLPTAKEKESSPAGVTVDAAALLPADRGYYTFTGSLTTPPCSEGVTWFVLKNPSSISAEQLATFAKRYPHNARPLQPLNNRVVVMTR